MQLWSLIGHSWCLLMWGFLEFFKLGIFSTKNCLLLGKQFIFDIWWSSLDIMDDFKLISRTVIFHLGEINNIMIFSFVKKIFFHFFLVRYYISNYKKNISKFFFQNWKKRISKNFFQNFFFQFWKKKIWNIFFIIGFVITN